MVKSKSSNPKSKKTLSKKDVSKKTVVEESASKVVVEESASKVVVEESAPEEETVVNDSSSDTELKDAVSVLFDSLVAQGESMNAQNRLMLQLLKKTSKSYARERKDFDKNLARERRRAKKDPNRRKREPSGFAVATDISDKLCDFLKVPKGTQLSRTDVTRKVTTYIREKNLQITDNRRAFKPDKALKGILGNLQDKDKEKGFTYFNLQRYITPHITSSASSSSSSS